MGLINALGIALNLVGVVLLFRYGMPYRVPRGGASFLLLEGTDHKDLEQEILYRRLGNVGLGFIVLGSIAQVYVAIRTLPLLALI